MEIGVNWPNIHASAWHLAHLAIHQTSPKSAVEAEIYGQLNITLIHESHPGQGAPTLLTALCSRCMFVVLIYPIFIKINLVYKIVYF